MNNRRLCPDSYTVQQTGASIVRKINRVKQRRSNAFVEAKIF